MPLDQVVSACRDLSRVEQKRIQAGDKPKQDKFTRGNRRDKCGEDLRLVRVLEKQTTLVALSNTPADLG